MKTSQCHSTLAIIDIHEKRSNISLNTKWKWGTRIKLSTPCGVKNFVEKVDKNSKALALWGLHFKIWVLNLKKHFTSAWLSQNYLSSFTFHAFAGRHFESATRSISMIFSSFECSFARLIVNFQFISEAWVNLCGTESIRWLKVACAYVHEHTATYEMKIYPGNRSRSACAVFSRAQHASLKLPDNAGDSRVTLSIQVIFLSWGSQLGNRVRRNTPDRIHQIIAPLTWLTGFSAWLTNVIV